MFYTLVLNLDSVVEFSSVRIRHCSYKNKMSVGLRSLPDVTNCYMNAAIQVGTEIFSSRSQFNHNLLLNLDSFQLCSI